MDIVLIERVADDGLSGTWWKFWFNHHGSTPVIYLDTCFEWTRPTRRHMKTLAPGRDYDRFVNGTWYEAAKRGSGWLPPLPDDVIAEAREKLCDGGQHNDHARRVAEARIVAPTQADIDRIRETGR